MKLATSLDLYRCEIFYDNRRTEYRLLTVAQIRAFKKTKAFKERVLSFKRLEILQVRLVIYPTIKFKPIRPGS